MKRVPAPTPQPYRRSTQRGGGAPRANQGFTLVELIVIIVVLAILAGVAIPKYIDYSTNAKNAADTYSVGCVNSALQYTHLQHRVQDAAAGVWITDMSQVAACMSNSELPTGFTISGSYMYDTRGNQYHLAPETLAVPARLVPGP